MRKGLILPIMLAIIVLMSTFVLADDLKFENVDVFFDGVLIGSVNDGKKFVSDVISSRRGNKIPRLLNVSFDENENGDDVYLHLENILNGTLPSIVWLD